MKYYYKEGQGLGRDKGYKEVSVEFIKEQLNHKYEDAAVMDLVKVEDDALYFEYIEVYE